MEAGPVFLLKRMLSFRDISRDADSQQVESAPFHQPGNADKRVSNKSDAVRCTEISRNRRQAAWLLPADNLDSEVSIKPGYTDDDEQRDANGRGEGCLESSRCRRASV
jgi:hypothetical protein